MDTLAQVGMWLRKLDRIRKYGGTTVDGLGPRLSNRMHNDTKQKRKNNCHSVAFVCFHLFLYFLQYS